MNSLFMNHSLRPGIITLENKGTSWLVCYVFPDGAHDCECATLAEAYNEALAVSMCLSCADYNGTYL